MSSPKRIVLGLGVGVVGLAWSLASDAAQADVVAVVSTESPVTALGASEVADIFLGKANHLPGGGVAVPIDQAEGSPARDAFYDRFTGKSPAQLKAHWSKIVFTGQGHPPREVANGIEAKKLVARNPNAIAYIDRAEVDASVRVLDPP